MTLLDHESSEAVAFDEFASPRLLVRGLLGLALTVNIHAVSDHLTTVFQFQ